MSSIRDIEYATKGEPNDPKKTKTLQDYRPEKTPEPIEVNKSSQITVFRLYDSNKDGGVRIQAIDHVIDPKSITEDKPQGNGPEMIRLLNGVTSIWERDQKGLDKKWIDRNIRYIEFPRGSKFMAVPAWDVALLEFMRLTRHNVKTGNRRGGTKTEFFEYDANAAAKDKYSAQMLEIEMIIKANEQSKEKMEKHAFHLGIKLFDELTGAPKSEQALRTEYILAAKTSPKFFKESMDSKEVDAKFKVRNAIVGAKLDVSRGDGRIYYGAGGGIVCNLPREADPIKYLTELYLTNSQEGTAFKKELDKMST